jgi:predicted NBD/HSP70 family sugar kinase
MSRKTGQAAKEVEVQTTRAGTNIGGAGEHNRRVVLHGLRVNGALSRAQIARNTGLVPQTVSNIIEELERDGLVIAAEPVRAGRGRAATPYSLAPNGAFAYGMQLDQHRARVVAIDLLGRMVAATEATLGPGRLETNLAPIMAALSRVADDLARHAGQSAPRVLGLGLAMPAPTGVHAGHDDPWMVGLSDEHPLVRRLAGQTGLPVSLHHDASAAAVAERLSGSAKGIDNFALIFVSYGLGAGIYINGELYRGHHRLAGELGQIIVPRDGRPVPLERLTALVDLINRLGLRPNQPDLLLEMERAVEGEHPEVARWLSQAVEHLNWAIDLVDCLVDPERVIIGGQMPAVLLRRLIAAVLSARPVHAVDRGDRHLHIVAGSADPFFVATGAAAEPITRAFAPSFAAMLKPSA